MRIVIVSVCIHRQVIVRFVSGSEFNKRVYQKTKDKSADIQFKFSNLLLSDPLSFFPIFDTEFCDFPFNFIQIDLDCTDPIMIDCS